MSKFIETDFVRFLYSDGSEASLEKKEIFKSSKQNSIESMGGNICEIYGFRHETKGGY